MPERGQALSCHITAVGSYPVCVIYRFEIPLRRMIARSWCSASIYGAPGSVDYDEMGLTFAYTLGNPLLTQRNISLDAPTVDMLHANRCQFIHDIDDLLWEIPPDNVARMSPLLLANMDVSLRLADLVTTSTEPLAAALEQRGISAVVIPNLLDPADWDIMPKRTERSRLRVGWYGQRDCHVEDLNVIEKVVTALSREVDFVFYGDLPKGLVSQRVAFESYAATTIELFPTMLAMLDLDILLAPLAKNSFNECKSNLRLTQAGMLGYAVIATEIEPHSTLPVQLVDNKPRSWIRAIRERIGELDAVRAEGQILRHAVCERYALNDSWAEQIFTTWTRRAPPEEITE